MAILLNVLPGLGTGYLYQRRWRAYWITATANGAWILSGALLNQGDGASIDPKTQFIGLLGLTTLGLITAFEARLAVKKVRQAGSQE